MRTRGKSSPQATLSHYSEMETPHFKLHCKSPVLGQSSISLSPVYLSPCEAMHVLMGETRKRTGVCHLRSRNPVHVGPASLLGGCHLNFLTDLLSPPQLEQSSLPLLTSSIRFPAPPPPPYLVTSALQPPSKPTVDCRLSGWVGVILLPHIVVPLDVNLVKYPLRGLQEVFLHLHGDIPGQEAHEQPLLHRRDMLCQTVRTSSFPLA